MSKPKSTTTQSADKADTKGPPLSLRLDAELEQKVKDASAKTKLSRSDIARLAIERGLQIVVTQLTTLPTAA